VAKSRRRSAAKKSKAKAKAKPARKRAARRTPAKAARPAGPPTRIELRGVREFAQTHVDLIGAHPSPGPRALEVRDTLQAWLRDIERSCGADMTIPFA
jgi:hypothetical protein